MSKSAEEGYYDKVNFLKRVQEAADKDPAQFYNQKFVNYRGNTTGDSRELFTEVIARWMCENLDGFVESIPTVTREESYRTDGHLGGKWDGGSNREEEWIGKEMKACGELPVIGEILDYQTPLKNKAADHAGKIDVLSYDGHVMRILELKRPRNNETMLRCVLEALTYWKTVCRKKLAHDFGHDGAFVCANPFVAKGGAQQKEMEQGRPELERLMRELDERYEIDMRPIYYEKLPDGSYVVSF